MSATESTPDLQTNLAAAFRLQAFGANGIGSALYEDLCNRCADDVDNGGVVWELLEAYAHLRFEVAVPLRFLAAVHRVVLRGNAAGLAAQYPSSGGTPTTALWSVFLDAVHQHRAVIAAELGWGVQTNEVVRTAALFPSLAHIQATTGLPVSLREIGTSSGLNLRLDRFHYVQGNWSAGDPSSGVTITDRWGDRTPPPLPLTIVDRAGCDPAPIDPTTPDGAIHLLGFLWPDQVDRRERSRAAIEIAQRTPARIDRANADTWLDRELANRTAGAVTVVMHSIVWPYIDHDERERITACIERTGEAATTDAPLAWLSFEEQLPQRTNAAITLRLWDGTSNGERRVLAECGFHGQWVRWLG